MSTFLLGGRDQGTASATAIAADFDPGNIISDATFFDSYAMSDDQIQAFLTGRGANCVAGQEKCLKDYTATTIAHGNDGLCAGYAGGLVQSAAQIIGGVARSCGINPEVLIVLLEKEQGLVTGTRPTTGAYLAATGYGCPDSSPSCDSTYAGFFYQLYGAARQYQIYAANPAGYPRYRAGQWDSIQYNPALSCGAENVYIANQATAGLYIYTPYVPNAAAMNNLYGLGDACSSYGNRNFWRLFTDWFGNPQAGSDLLRTATNPTVYLVSGSMKYPIPDMATVISLAPLGQVGYVSQQYLDRRTTGPQMSRVVLAPNGIVYFIDSGIKLPFATCAQVADFGATCGSLNTMVQQQVDLFYPGPQITNLYRTTSGKAFYVTGATKREVVDDAALTAAGLPTASVTLLESGLAALPYGPPVTRDGVVLQDRSTGALTASIGGTFTTLPDGVRTATALSSLPVRPLDDASIRQLTRAQIAGPIVRDTSSSTVYLLTGQGKKRITDPTMVPSSTDGMDPAALSFFPDAGTLDAGTFVKGSAKGTVFELQAGSLRPVLSWADLVALDGGTTSPPILSVDQRLTDLLSVGTSQLGPGSLVVAPRSSTVYLVNGSSELIPVSTFSITDELGATRLVHVSNADVDAYTVRTSTVSMAVDCSGTHYLGLGGKLYKVASADVETAYNLSYMTLDPLTCTALPKASVPLSRFLWTGSGTIYYVDAGTKRPISTYAAYVTLGGTSANTLKVSTFALAQLPTGSAV